MENELFFERLKNDAEIFSAAIDKKIYAADDKELSGLFDSARYSLMAGGKRIRPVLALEFCRLFGGKDECVIPYGVALEMIHTASLIHDDLPAIDNDDLRRGRPTNHKVYGESTALLAGDSMFLDPFGVIADNNLLSAELNIQAVSYLSHATGAYGLVGGEFIDTVGECRELTEVQLIKTHSLKTGALIRAAAVLGATAAGVKLADPKMNDVITYANCIGLCFQIVDDMLDVIGTVEALGKTPGSDERENKTTFLSFYTLDEAKKKAENITDEAIAAISKYEGSEFLVSFAKYLLDRKN